MGLGALGLRGLEVVQVDSESEDSDRTVSMYWDGCRGSHPLYHST